MTLHIVWASWIKTSELFNCQPWNEIHPRGSNGSQLKCSNNFHFRHARDLRFTCSRLALLSVLRSWAGTIEFCDPNKPSGLKAIVDILYLNQLEVRVSRNIIEC